MKDVNLLIANGVAVNASLELLGDLDTYEATLCDFLEEIDEKVANIKKYKEKGDLENYAILVHSLKSDSRYLGFNQLADLSYHHEMASKEGDVDYVDSHFQELMVVLEDVVSLVRKYMNGEKSIEKMATTSDSSLGKKILVVDDSNIVRNLIEKIFRDEYHIIMAGDGNEAISALSSSSDISGILLDLYMPNANGFTVLNYLQRENLFSKIPVVIVTGNTTKETMEDLAKYPIIDILAKPFDENNIRRVMRAIENFK